MDQQVRTRLAPGGIALLRAGGLKEQTHTKKRNRNPVLSTGEEGREREKKKKEARISEGRGKKEEGFFSRRLLLHLRQFFFLFTTTGPASFPHTPHPRRDIPKLGGVRTRKDQRGMASPSLPPADISICYGRSKWGFWNWKMLCEARLFVKVPNLRPDR